MQVFLPGLMKPYRLKIVQDAIDETDKCPLYQIRVALDPIKQMMDDDLKCSKIEPPTLDIVIKDDNFILNQAYQLSNEFFEKYSKGTTSKYVSYDINIQIPDVKR